MVTIRIAELNVALDNKYPYLEDFVRDYVTDGPADFTVSATEEEIYAEARLLEGVNAPPEQLETVVLYRKIANLLPQYDAAVFHGSVIEDSGQAYIITARSGVGKTTHSRLWLSEFGGDVRILNGDKPIIRIIDGVPYACGTPWQGKERYGVNAVAPLRAVAFLARGTRNVARQIPTRDAVMRFVSQMYLDREEASGLLLSMRLADRILSSVALFEFECNMDAEAARVARQAITEAIKNFDIKR